MIRPTSSNPSTQWDSGAAAGTAPVVFDDDIAIDAAAARSLHVAVVGAGAFGGWTALHLLRAGANVTLLDAWGPGNARSSSSGETRAMRSVYGGDSGYVLWTTKARRMWRALESDTGETLLSQSAVLWMAGEDDRYLRASLPDLSNHGLPFDELALDDAARRFPQINFDGVAWVLLEHDAGMLYAGHACRTVKDRFVSEGGIYSPRAAAVSQAAMKTSTLSHLDLSDGTTLSADKFVFACGPWLGGLFPEVIAPLIVPTRQEVYYLDTPAGDDRFDENHLPVWFDFTDTPYYGFPASTSRGFKIADDTRGPPIDPTNDDRVPDAESVQRAQRYLAQRFPAMAGAPLVEALVCQYSNTPDGHFIIDRHPSAANVWIVGGGSGHGFKLGPAIGDFVARLVVADRAGDPFFALGRFAK